MATKMIRPEDAPDVEVREADQLKICRFGVLNEQLKELRSDKKALEDAIQKMDDASTELMMSEGDSVKILMGDTFLTFQDDAAVEYCDKKSETLQEKLDDVLAQEQALQDSMAALKEELYGRFGTSINLEDK